MLASRGTFDRVRFWGHPAHAATEDALASRAAEEWSADELTRDVLASQRRRFMLDALRTGKPPLGTTSRNRMHHASSSVATFRTRRSAIVIDACACADDQTTRCRGPVEAPRRNRTLEHDHAICIRLHHPSAISRRHDASLATMAPSVPKTTRTSGITAIPFSLFY